MVENIDFLEESPLDLPLVQVCKGFIETRENIRKEDRIIKIQ